MKSISDYMSKGSVMESKFKTIKSYKYKDENDVRNTTKELIDSCKGSCDELNNNIEEMKRELQAYLKVLTCLRQAREDIICVSWGLGVVERGLKKGDPKMDEYIQDALIKPFDEDYKPDFEKYMAQAEKLAEEYGGFFAEEIASMYAIFKGIEDKVNSYRK